jgi:hypothetical protein
MTTRDGISLIITGERSLGGARVAVRSAPDREAQITADPGDYLYGSDVRADSDNDRLYVKARGTTALGDTKSG